MAISIHAPHEGERHCHNAILYITDPFQSTLPTRGSDAVATSPAGAHDAISIHAPHEGERPRFPILTITAGIFQSTLPTRGSD